VSERRSQVSFRDENLKADRNQATYKEARSGEEHSVGMEELQ